MTRTYARPVAFAFGHFVLFTLLLGLVAAAAPSLQAAGPKHLLVVTVTKGFRHDSIPVSETVLKQLGETSKSYTVDYVRTDEDMAQKMTADALKNYDGVIFANTTGDLPIPDKDAFVRWIRAGHAFIGMHAATDTYHGFEPYKAMLGAEFLTHGPQVEVNCLVEDKKHPATRHLGDSWKVFDEIYQFQHFDRARFHGLLGLDKHPNAGTPGDFPISWCRMEGKGRLFYTALGHRQEVWRDPVYQQHILGGIRWALGQEKGDAKPQKRASNELKSEQR